ncbi:9431_t:CDS:2 [Acaulospora morrowiae]|uniref:9431_t:CDS:1 n=1 Tax=Acaulospora morrowiae TaxID=94023 RepID=A0A9N9G9I2_9GLOM|nr:9431_t:CDS:2 [Acaulospora morrowiae]
MAWYERYPDLLHASDSEAEDYLMVTQSSETRQLKRKRSENNDRKSICWNYFEEPKEMGAEIKCTIAGCTTKYTWHGSTSNLVSHLKTKHNITKPLESTSAIQSSSTNNNSIISELEINLPLINFIVSSLLPFSVVDDLKSAGLANSQIEQSSSNLIKIQTNEIYDHLFSQLILLAHQAKTIVVSRYFSKKPCGEFYVVITYCWMNEDFDFHRILLSVKRFFEKEKYEKNNISEYITSTIDKWKLANLRSIRCDNYDIKDVYFPKYEIYKDHPQNELLSNSLLSWKNSIATSNNIEKSFSNIFIGTDELKEKLQNIKAIIPSTINDIETAEKIKCHCDYHCIEFIRLMEQPIRSLVDTEIGEFCNEYLLNYLPFSIFPKLLDLFRPLEHSGNDFDYCLSRKDFRDILVNIVNALYEPPQIIDLEHDRILKSFLSSFISYFLGNKDTCIGLFLDPRLKSSSKSSHFFDDIREYALNSCQEYYLEYTVSNSNLDKTEQESAKDELNHYIGCSFILTNENKDLCEWWKKSKLVFPGLANLAREYFPALLVDGYTLYGDNIIWNLDRLAAIYDDELNEMAILHYNMKHINA